MLIVFSSKKEECKLRPNFFLSLYEKNLLALTKQSRVQRSVARSSRAGGAKKDTLHSDMQGIWERV